MRKCAYLFVILTFIIINTISCSNRNSSQSPKNTSENNPPSPIERTQVSENNTGFEQALPLVPSPAPTSETTPSPPAPTEVPKDTVLGSFQTVLLNKDKERVDNIRLAASKINGYKILPGKTFSFNNVVGKRTTENGFKVASIIINGEYEEGLGGGVCQLSSTLYNAADKAGLKIVERHPHTKQVAYVPLGRDAAISYGHMDLKFKNTKDFLIVIKAQVKNGKVYTSISKAE